MAFKRVLHMDQWQRLAARALSEGGRRVTLMTIEWYISGDCYSPVMTEVMGRPAGKRIVVGPGTAKPGIIQLHTRCRRCERCLKARMRRWSGAVRREVGASQRTWFGTLTLSPDAHFRMQMGATARLAAAGVDFDRLNESEQFAERHKQIGPELTKYVKRVRKNSGARLRYLVVTEVHKSGLPHYHMLVHEDPLGGMVRHRHLSEAWTLGFEKWRLSSRNDPKDNPTYLCKYLSKSLLARVRASQGYGVATSDLHTYVIDTLERECREGIRHEDNFENFWSGEGLDP